MSTEPLEPIVQALRRGDAAFVATLIARCGGELAKAARQAGVLPGVDGTPSVDHVVQEVALAVADLAPTSATAESSLSLVERAAALVAREGFGEQRTVHLVDIENLAGGPSQHSLFSSGAALRLSVDTLRSGLADVDVDVGIETDVSLSASAA